MKRPLSTDDHRQWGVGYGVEVAVPYHYTSHVVVQQAYVEGRWKKATLTIGAKEQPMQLKDNQLSSGSQTLGINARLYRRCALPSPTIGRCPSDTDGSTSRDTLPMAR